MMQTKFNIGDKVQVKAGFNEYFFGPDNYFADAVCGM